MVKYHPDARYLTDFTAGCLPTAQALCVSTHLHYCIPCKLKVRELTELGSMLFMQLPPAAVKTDEFDRLVSRLDSLNGFTVPSPTAMIDTPGLSLQITLPRSLRKLARGDLESLKWQRIGNSYRYCRLNVGCPRPAETTLFHIRAGGYVPHHRHDGDEITVVIRGSFSDHDDNYSVGDFIVRTTGEQHRPVASQNEDCLCLSSLDKPIIISSWFYRLLSPLM